ncbi:hypothetical protein BU17DRAFT_81861 [Hysterangium stoloniferum]|nr:hypothetical protein BU17DRAFT_81861 [Hysterangium stoloniferum]
MSANLDKSLDEVISSRRTGGRRGGRRGGGVKASLVGASAPGGPRTRVSPLAVTTPQVAITPQVSDKIIVSNLPFDVNESQIRELFSQMIGPLRDVTLTYDSRGVSKGIASVVFNRSGDAAKAYTQYHDRLIDGKRPMKIEIVVDPRKATSSLAARVSAPAPAVDNMIIDSVPRGARGGGRRGGRGRGRGGRKHNERPEKTVEDLDAEMADYTGTAPAVTAASA